MCGWNGRSGAKSDQHMSRNRGCVRGARARSRPGSPGAPRLRPSPAPGPPVTTAPVSPPDDRGCAGVGAGRGLVGAVAVLDGSGGVGQDRGVEQWRPAGGARRGSTCAAQHRADAGDLRVAGGVAQQAQPRLDPGDLHTRGYPDWAVAEGDLLDLEGAAADKVADPVSTPFSVPRTGTGHFTRAVTQPSVSSSAARTSSNRVRSSATT